METEDIQTKDGITLRGVPKGTPEDQIRARIQQIRSLGQEGAPRNPGMVTPSGEKDLSPTSPANLAGHPLTRFATGAAKPLMGAVQLGANLLGSGDQINEHMRGYNQLEQQGRKNMGSEGFDWWSAVGQALSPAYLGAAKALPNAATTTGRIGQGAAVGAAAGAAEPVYDPSQYVATKAGQIGMGAGMGAAIPGAWEAGKAVGRGVRNFFQPSMGEWGANRSAGRLANQVAGDKADNVINSLSSPTQIVPGSMPTAGQAAVPAGSAEFSSLQRIASDRDPSKYYGPQGIEGAQNKARVNSLRSVGGTPESLAAAETLRAKNAAQNYSPELMGTKVSPDSQNDVMAKAIRERYLSRASALQDQGRFNTTAAQADEFGANFVPVPGQPRVSQRASNFPERSAEANKAASSVEPIVRTRMAEEKYLSDLQMQLQNTVGLENKSLHDFLGRPSVKRALKEAAEAAAETGSYFPQRTGEEFSVGNLQRIKQALSDEINKNTAQQGLGATQKREITGTVDEFTKWISNKAPDWGKARVQYAEDSIPINQMQVGQYLEQKLVPALTEDAKQRSTSYAQALRDAPGTIKRSTGGPRFEELEKVLNPNQMNTVTAIKNELSRDATGSEMSRRGMASALERIGASMPDVPATGILDPKISASRAIINRFTGQATKKILDQLSKNMDNPQMMAKLMREAKPFERQAIMDELMRYQATTPQVIDQGR